VTRVGGLLLLATLAGACTRGPVVRASWTGIDTGTAVLRARAAWCGSGGPLVIFGQAGDTGIGLAVYPVDSLLAARYGVFDPTRGVTRPGAAVAARWTRKMVMADLRGTTGDVTLTRVGDAVSGRFSARTTGVVMAGAVSIAGSFSGIPLARGGADCPGASR
jgi:hypothetical protein